MSVDQLYSPLPSISVSRGDDRVAAIREVGEGTYRPLVVMRGRTPIPLRAVTLDR